MFEQLWKLYPRKVAKREAMKAWNKLSTDQQQQAMQAIENHVAYWQACNTETQFIPHCSTWLNQWRFEDELEMPKKQSSEIKVAWWSTEQGMLEKGREHNTSPRPGEDWAQFKSRLIGLMQRAA